MKPQDEKAAAVEFGVEIETQIPMSAGIPVGHYHQGTPVINGVNPTTHRRIQAPEFNGARWRAERDGSIRCDPGYTACEFVSPILRGEEGLAVLRKMVVFLKKIGAQVNQSCGLHVTIGIKSVIGTPAPEAVADFVRKLAHTGQRHAWAIYAQTGTDRHANQYAHTLSTVVGDHVAAMTQTTEQIRLSTLASQCGRGMINFKKAFQGEAGCVEFRAFAGTLNEAKLLHHLASALGIVRRASQVSSRNIGRFDRKSTKKHSKIKTAVEALRKMWRSLGWLDAAEGRDCALGLFGALYREFGEYRQAAMKMAEQFETRFPNANL